MLELRGEGAPRVLLTDAEQRSVLAACRGLGAAGFRVAAAASRTPAPGHWSHHCEARFRVPDPRDDRAAYVETLEVILRAREHDVLVPGTDASLIAVSEHRDRLAPYTTLGLPPHDVVLRSLDKLVLLEEAAAVGLPCPVSRVALDQGEVIAAARDLGYPVVLKPASSLVQVAGACWQRPATVIQDEETLVRALPQFGTPVILQRYELEGRLVSFAGVAADGGLLAVAVSRYARTWPPIAGSASFSETLEPAPELVQDVSALIARIGWQGIFELELLEGGSTGLAALDLNPRLYGSVALAIRSGVNLPAVWCTWLLGGSVSPSVGRSAIRYRWEEGEIRNVVWSVRRGKLRRAASIIVPRRHVVHAHFRLADPAPLAAWAWDGVKRVVARLGRSPAPANRLPTAVFTAAAAASFTSVGC